jgi:hypothetical protein
VTALCVLILRALALVCVALLFSLSTDQSTTMLLCGGVGLMGLIALFWRAADALTCLEEARRWGR